MKKTLLCAAILLVSCITFAQSGSGFGLKGGLNYNQNGDLIGSIANAGENILEGSEGRAGFHIGVYGKIDLLKLYVRPELFFTQTKSSYDLNGDENDFDISKIDLPVSVYFK